VLLFTVLHQKKLFKYEPNVVSFQYLCTFNRYYISQFGTCLPNADPHKDERSKELEILKELYQFGQTAPDLPVQVSVFSNMKPLLNLIPSSEIHK
jgi:hypothetical protein